MLLRIKFESGQQEKFINYCLQKTKINLRKLAEKVNCSYFNIKKYKKEVCCIPEDIFMNLCRISGIKSENLNISYIPDNWGQVKGGKLGILGMREKYADKLSDWRIKGGKNHSRKV